MGLKKHIPNAFTLGNLVLGAIAIIYIVEGVEPLYGVYCLILALVFDFLDGLVARALNVSSEIGKELDSLADVISFGLAPSVIAFKFISPAFYEIGTQSGALIWNVLGFSVFVMAAASAYRLAKFNLDDSQTYSFKGLPTPANAMFWIGLIGAWETGILPDFAKNFLANQPWYLLILVIAMSWLMVSNLSMFSLKFKPQNQKAAIFQAAAICTGLILLVFFKWLALPLIVILYIIFSIVKSLLFK